MEVFMTGIIIIILLIATLIFFRKPISIEAQGWEEDVIIRQTEKQVPRSKELIKLEKEWNELIKNNGGNKPKTASQLLAEMRGEE